MFYAMQIKLAYKHNFERFFNFFGFCDSMKIYIYSITRVCEDIIFLG